MAQWTITRTCGHAVTEQIYGKSADRERRANWLAAQPCTTCKRTAELAEAQAASTDLPALVGSDKQIAWATTIRHAGLASIEATLREFERQATGIPAETIEQQRALFRAYRETLVGQTSAAWWIDHRDESGRRLLAVAAGLVQVPA